MGSAGFSKFQCFIAGAIELLILGLTDQRLPPTGPLTGWTEWRDSTGGHLPIPARRRRGGTASLVGQQRAGCRQSAAEAIVSHFMTGSRSGYFSAQAELEGMLSAGLCVSVGRPARWAVNDAERHGYPQPLATFDA